MSRSTDRYLDLVNSGPGSALASRLGLPRPAVLRRYVPEGPLLPGPLLLGETPGGLGGLAELLSGAGAEVLRVADDSARYGALLFDATALTAPSELAGLREFLAAALRRLLPSARVVLLGRAPSGDDPVADAARQALDGIVRSLAKELRAGATANLLLLAGRPPTANGLAADAQGDRETGAGGAVDGEAAALESSLRFLLSGRSAYVDGQVLTVRPDAPTVATTDWSRPLAGRTALVTGAARGIGAAIAEALARDGAEVVVADLPAAGEALARVANRIGGSALQLDIAAPDAPSRLTGYLIERHGGVDLLVHNAGITRDKLMANMKPAAWDSVLAVNLESQLRINAELLASDALREHGRVVCLASTSGIAGNRGQTNYAASKAGVIGMVRSFAPAFGQRSATINAVAPGFIDTEMTRSIPFATREVARRISSLQQAGQPIDVAEAVAFLGQPGSGAITGQVLRVCGQNLVGA